uniref:class I SAM-dependent DNA methyltransferase n=1 Tax=Stappia sp. TaxID=1870903 RepID=UPI003BA849BC
MSHEEAQLERIVNLGGDRHKILEFYEDWASTYARDVVEGIGYTGHVLTAKAVTARVGPEAEILDVGCGTGLVAVELKQRRPALRIDGIDLTRGMLDEAEETQAYRSLVLGDMNHPLNADDDTYDGIVSSGVFTTGHVGPERIDELVRVARPGSPIVLAIRDTAWEGEGFSAHVDLLERQGRLRVEECRREPYLLKTGVFCQLCVLAAA